jgi:hypothetical protein
VLTDLLLSLGVTELLRPRWTTQIHEEWMRNLLADRPELERAKIERRRDQMDAALDDCLVTGYEAFAREIVSRVVEIDFQPLRIPDVKAPLRSCLQG